VQLLLTASEEARLRRRSAELHGETDAAAIERTRDEVVRRDQDDSRVSQFLTAADGVVTLDTSDLTFEESVAAALAVVDAARG
jgi:cytidylate kinase